MLRRVSRTFALSIEQLPPVLREIVEIAYLMFRISDALEDHPTLTADKKSELLTLWAKVLQNKIDADTFLAEISSLDYADPEIQVAQNADKILDELMKLPPQPQLILIKHVIDTSIGMARWQTHGPFVKNEQEMDDYMHQVAGRVGYLLTEIFTWYLPSISRLKDRLMPLGRQFGLALQTVNIIRGIRKDYERGWVFIPEEYYKSAGISRDDLFKPENIDKALPVLNMLTKKAEQHLEKGLEYIKLLPRTEHRIRLFCIWPLLFAAKTLSLSRNNPDVFLTEAKITRKDVRKIIILSKLFGWSNWFLETSFRYFSAKQESSGT
jgi:farnesyl-diphosphate farnesyltransferase